MRHILNMGKILYHLKGANAVSIEFDAEDWENEELKGKIAVRVLESLKVQNVLDVVVFTSDENKTINLI